MFMLKHAILYQQNPGCKKSWDFRLDFTMLLGDGVILGAKKQLDFTIGGAYPLFPVRL